MTEREHLLLKFSACHASNNLECLLRGKQAVVTDKDRDNSFLL